MTDSENGPRFIAADVTCAGNDELLSFLGLDKDACNEKCKITTGCEFFLSSMSGTDCNLYGDFAPLFEATGAHYFY